MMRDALTARGRYLIAMSRFDPPRKDWWFVFTYIEHGRPNRPPRGFIHKLRVVCKVDQMRTRLPIIGLIFAGGLGLAQLVDPRWSLAEDRAPAAALIKISERTSYQDQGAWVVDYRFKNIGQTPITIGPDRIKVKVEGWVSNSRVASHALPHWSSLVIPRGPELWAVSDVINGVDEASRCREKLIVTIRPDEPRRDREKPHQAPDPGSTKSAGATKPAGSDTVKVDSKLAPAVARIDSTAATRSERSSSASKVDSNAPSVVLEPGERIRVRLRIEHQHMVYGDYDPLLASRTVELSLGGAIVRDLVRLDREQYVAHPRFQWPDPPVERRDDRHFVSAPDSLHLEAHVPGHHYYRFPERPVRYSSKMRLRFWYLIAAGTEGECRAKIAQYKDTPTTWKRLNDGGFDQCLKTVGRWTRVERIFMTEAEATTVALEFTIVGETDVGEMWIDNVTLEPMDVTTPGGP